MALSNDVLKNFFNKTNKPLNEPLNRNNNLSPVSISNYRVFDDPIDKNIPKIGTNTSEQVQDTDGTNLGQTRDKVRTKLRTNLRQTQDKPLTNSGQTQDKGGTELRTERRTNLGQTQDNVLIPHNFSSLVGLQRKITLFLYEICKLSRSRITTPLSTEHIATSCETTKFSVHKSLQRLEYKQVILRNSFKNGRGGWTKYELSDAIFQEIIFEETQSKLRTNQGQTQDKLRTELRTELRTTSSSSGSSDINNKTTTTNAPKELPEEWLLINLDPLRNIGFTITHLTQIAKQQILTPSIVEDSINAFAFDLTHNKKGAALKGSPLNYFMGILRNGLPYAPPGNYESPQDKGMRVYLERKLEIEQVRKIREEEIIKAEFLEWEREQSEEAKQALLPEEIKSSKLLAAKKAFLRTYFIKEIWPQKCKELEKEIFNVEAR